MNAALQQNWGVDYAQSGWKLQPRSHGVGWNGMQNQLNQRRKNYEG